MDFFTVTPDESLSEVQIDLLKNYASSISFKELFDRYRKDEKFRSVIDYITASK